MAKVVSSADNKLEVSKMGCVSLSMSMAVSSAGKDVSMVGVWVGLLRSDAVVQK